jgi:hypothetical protein
MAWQQYLPDDRLKWTRNWNSLPIWSTEPDVSVIKNLVWSKYARPNLAHSGPFPDKNQLEVEFLVDGAHHKVYDVKYPAWPKPLVFRVAIPMDPTFKIKSEVSTFRFWGSGPQSLSRDAWLGVLLPTLNWGMTGASWRSSRVSS